MSRQYSKFVSLAEAAEYLGLHTKTVRRYISDGILEGYRVGPRVLRVRRESLDEVTHRLATAPNPRHG